MAWKRFRPSVLRTVCQSMYIGALISLLTPAFIGLLYVIISYVPYDTCGFFVGMLFLFRPYQLKGVKRKLILVAFVLSCVDTVYRVVLQLNWKVPYFILRGGVRIEKRGSTIGYNVSPSTFIYLMTEWRNQKGECLTREPNIFPSLILCEIMWCSAEKCWLWSPTNIRIEARKEGIYGTI